MIQSTLFQPQSRFALILVCAMLSACATTQKSSTGSGAQAAAPISEAATPQTAAKPGDKPAASSLPSNAASPSSATPAAPVEPAAAADATSADTAAKPASSESVIAGPDADEAAQLKHQLAEQDAQINKLRNDQQAEVAREEAVTSPKEADTSAAQDQPSAAASTQRPESPVAATKPDDSMAVFPSNSAAAEDNGVQPSVPRPAERSVYFAYDQASVADKYDAMLMANAAYLKARPTIRPEVQGNCDERGSREYNLALGARRAETVKRALELAGVDGSRINTVSFGAEKPVASGKDEASYSQNRRADIVY